MSSSSTHHLGQKKGKENTAIKRWAGSRKKNKKLFLYLLLFDVSRFLLFFPLKLHPKIRKFFIHAFPSRIAFYIRRRVHFEIYGFLLKANFIFNFNDLLVRTHFESLNLKRTPGRDSISSHFL